MTAISVDCVFAADGSVRIKRIQRGDKWEGVSQGRQWLDQHGRHVLVMFNDREIREVVLRVDSMAWEMKRRRSEPQIV